MKYIKLSLSESLMLYNELNGMQNNEGTVISGFLNSKMNMKTKYWLTKLKNQLKKEVDLVENMRQELITKYGKKDENGQISIKMLGDDNKPTENYQSFVKEFNELMSIEKTFKYNPLSLEDLENIESDGRYEILFELIDDKEDKEKELTETVDE